MTGTTKTNGSGGSSAENAGFAGSALFENSADKSVPAVAVDSIPATIRLPKPVKVQDLQSLAEATAQLARAADTWTAQVVAVIEQLQVQVFTLGQTTLGDPTPLGED